MPVSYTLILAEIESEFKIILSMLSTDMDPNAFAEKKITDLMVEKRELELELAHLVPRTNRGIKIIAFQSELQSELILKNNDA